jgi:hypothetical protein
MPPQNKTLSEALTEYRRGARREASVYLLVGTLMLCGALYLAQGDVPLLRQGRLLLVFVLGSAATAYGGYKLLHPGPPNS